MGLLKLLGYEKVPDHLIFSKVRRDIGEEKIGKLYIQNII